VPCSDAKTSERFWHGLLTVTPGLRNNQTNTTVPARIYSVDLPAVSNGRFWSKSLTSLLIDWFLNTCDKVGTRAATVRR